jgi:hypothetical protein
MKRDRPIKLRLLAAPLAAGLLLLAGCGGSSDNSGSSNDSGGGSASQNVAGPADFRANLIWLMSKSNPELKQVKADCPHEPPSGFKPPPECHFTAQAPAQNVTAQDRKANPKLARLVSRPHQVAGTIKVFGIYAKTRTYEFSLQFGPVS